jgi:hypothetical protein
MFASAALVSRLGDQAEEQENHKPIACEMSFRGVIGN